MTTNEKLAWMAGYLEGRGFQLRNDKNNTKWSDHWVLMMNSGRAERLEAFQQFAKFTNGKIYIHGNGNGWGERFSFNNRPAVFMDGNNLSWKFYLSGTKAQALLKQLYPYFGQFTRAKVKPLLEYTFCKSHRERGLKEFQTAIANGQK